jgi:hypothetical protein
MIARLLARLSLGPITLVYWAWGRCWLTDQQCRWLVMAIMRVPLWFARAKP